MADDRAVLAEMRPNHAHPPQAAGAPLRMQDTPLPKYTFGKPAASTRSLPRHRVEREPPASTAPAAVTDRLLESVARHLPLRGSSVATSASTRLYARCRDSARIT